MPVPLRPLCVLPRGMRPLPAALDHGAEPVRHAPIPLTCHVLVNQRGAEVLWPMLPSARRRWEREIRRIW
jgi:hypothetical protein